MPDLIDISNLKLKSQFFLTTCPQTSVIAMLEKKCAYLRPICFILDLDQSDLAITAQSKDLLLAHVYHVKYFVPFKRAYAGFVNIEY